MTRFASLLVVGLSLVPAAAAAQESQSISPGDRVRVSTTSGVRLTGRMLSLDAKEITFMPDQTMVPTAVTRDTITRLEVSRGRGKTKNVLRGALLGVALGVALGYAQGDNEGPGSIGFRVHSAEDKAFVGGLLLGSVGALVGGNYPSERWATATPTSAKSSQAIAAPAPSLRLSFRF